jgi:hypothetical protein
MHTHAHAHAQSSSSSFFLSFFLSFFIFSSFFLRWGLAMLPRLKQSSCLSLLGSWSEQHHCAWLPGFCVLSHPVCGILSQQPRWTKTPLLGCHPEQGGARSWQGQVRALQESSFLTPEGWGSASSCCAALHTCPSSPRPTAGEAQVEGSHSRL